MKRVGFIVQGTPPAGPPPDVAQAFRAHGWYEGQNIEFLRRGAKKPEELQAIAAEFVALRLDLVITDGTATAQAMQKATRTIPVFFNVAVDPVASGLVADLRHPGGNLTGNYNGLYNGKMLQLIKEVQPRASLVIYPVSNVARDATTAAKTLGMVARGIEVAGPEDLDRLFAEIQRERADALIIPPLPWLRPHILRRIADDLLARKLPAIGPDRDFVRNGGLMSFGPKSSSAHVVARIDKLLRGANPAETAVESPTEFDVAMNLKTAAAIGVTIPSAVLLRADHVIRE